MILIDGHNLIGHMADLNLDDPDDEERLVGRLRAYRACVGGEMVVYFDPGLTYRSPARRSEVGITVRYAGLGRQADQLIVRDILGHARPQELTVVTSDHAIRQAARERGCRLLDSAAFAADMVRPARRKIRRVRSRAKADHAPSLSKEEVKEWLQIFTDK